MTLNTCLAAGSTAGEHCAWSCRSSAACTREQPCGWDGASRALVRASNCPSKWCVCCGAETDQYRVCLGGNLLWSHFKKAHEGAHTHTHIHTMKTTDKRPRHVLYRLVGWAATKRLIWREKKTIERENVREKDRKKEEKLKIKKIVFKSQNVYTSFVI